MRKQLLTLTLAALGMSTGARANTETIWNYEHQPAADRAAAAAMTGTADDADQFVCQLKSGATVTWQLAEQPSVELKDGHFVVASTRATVTYAAEDVKHFILQKDPTAIEAPHGGKADAKGTARWAGAGQLLISGCKGGEPIGIYAADGRQVMRLKTDADGTLTIATDQLPAGVYIIKSQSINLKFAKK